MISTGTVLTHHLECFDKGDLEGLLSDYTEDTVLETGTGRITGLQPLRKIFSSLLKEFGRGKSSFVILRHSISDNHAFIIWKAETEDNVYHVGSDTFYILDGKIVYQTFAGYITPRS